MKRFCVTSLTVWRHIAMTYSEKKAKKEKNGDKFITYKLMLKQF